MENNCSKFNKLVYDASKITIWMFSKMFFLCRIKIKRLGIVADKGPAVIAASHKSWLDIPLLCLINKRYLHYVAKKELYENKISKWYLESTGCISINRGHKDNVAINRIIKTLKNDEVIAIYPEGTRNKEEGVGELNDGISVILLRNKIYPPIYPIFIDYEKGKLFGLPIKINIIIGKKICPEKFAKPSLLTEEIRRRLVNLYEILKNNNSKNSPK